jgi:hypothetical protein
MRVYFKFASPYFSGRREYDSIQLKLSVIQFAGLCYFFSKQALNKLCGNLALPCLPDRQATGQADYQQADTLPVVAFTGGCLHPPAKICNAPTHRVSVQTDQGVYCTLIG